MPYDLFISYSRRDNEQGRITQLVERIKTDFASFAKRELVPFFDQQEIHGMSDWRQRILQGPRESRLLLACLSEDVAIVNALSKYLPVVALANADDPTPPAGLITIYGAEPDWFEIFADLAERASALAVVLLETHQDCRARLHISTDTSLGGALPSCTRVIMRSTSSTI